MPATSSGHCEGLIRVLLACAGGTGAFLVEGFGRRMAEHHRQRGPSRRLPVYRLRRCSVMAQGSRFVCIRIYTCTTAIV